MNIVKLQDIKSTHRNPLHSYTLIIRKQKDNFFFLEREIKETIQLTIATERIKYLGIYIPKETKDLYIENYKTLVNELFVPTDKISSKCLIIWPNINYQLCFSPSCRPQNLEPLFLSRHRQVYQPFLLKAPPEDWHFLFNGPVTLPAHLTPTFPALTLLRQNFSFAPALREAYRP